MGLSVINPTTADNSLADVIWWLKGFAAAQPAEERNLRGEVAAMQENLRRVREWLDRLPVGLTRVLGRDQHTFACVLTEHELEVIIDGLRSNTNEDRDQALEKVRAIHKQFSNECREMTARRDPEAPF
jgi:hypothetical protein